MILRKRSHRNLFLLDNQHLAKLWSWRLQVSEPALSLNSGLHLQECWLTVAHSWQSAYALRSHHSLELTVIDLSPTIFDLYPCQCLSDTACHFGICFMFSSRPLPSSVFIYLDTHLSLAETIFLDICQSSSNSLIALLFWVKANFPTRFTKSFWTFSSVTQCVRLLATPWIAARQAYLSITDSRSLLKLMSIKTMMPSRNLILCRPLLLLPPIHPSIRVFSNESTLSMRCPKYWSFSFSISPSNEHPGLISFTMDCWISLQSKRLSRVFSNSTVQKHQFFGTQLSSTVQLSHPYMTTGKTLALTRWTFVDKVMSLLFNMLSRLVITFLPRSKCLLISWLQSPSAVIFGAPQNKVWHCFHCFPIYLPRSDETRCHDLSFLNVEL